MKRTDMKTGVVYAYDTGKYSTPTPIVVLDVSNIYRYMGNRYSGNKQWTLQPRQEFPTNPRMGRGYLAAYPTRDAVDLQALLECTLEQALELERGQKMPNSLLLMPVAPRQLLGEYEEVLAKLDRERKQREEDRRESSRRVQEAERHVRSLHDRMDALGIAHVFASYDTSPIQFTRDQAEVLLKRLESTTQTKEQ